ncbi:ABC transporter related [Syntrophobacter fumaroxidans MPOB]|uniref:ABC transporter related n=2 Tax=Syntrophobacter TaxID=29526 RepID=A0LFH0_SYNFM|nr:ABC transporter related [Syntrophobacter fumaroxidans MPOB]
MATAQLTAVRGDREKGFDKTFQTGRWARELEMDSSDMIVVDRLNSRYRGHQVLYDVSLTIPGSQVTVIMGVSGCGKTTLLRHLVGLKRTDPGRIFIEGEDLGSFDGRQLEDYRRRVGILFQSGALFNSMTVAENIAVPLKVHTRLADETIRLMALIKLNMVGLSDFCDFMPSQLSGGMKKRAGMARALAMDPEILFVDEPSSGLDPITAAGLDRLILDLREALGMTIVVVTHELESAFQIADQIIVMDQGRLLASGTPEAIRANTDERVVQFLQRRADSGQTGIENYLSSLLG